MRDITPKKRSKKPSFEQETRKLYEKDAEKMTPPALSPVKKKQPIKEAKESHVPVASIHVPRQQTLTSIKPQPQKTSPKPVGDIVSKKPQTVTLPKEALKPTTPSSDMKPFSRTPVESENIQKVDPKPKSKKASSPTVRPHLGTRERKIALIFILLVMLMVGGAAFLFLPKATISLTLQTAPLLVDQQLILSSAQSDSGDAVPATVFQKEVNVEGVSPTITTEVIGEKAHGTVQLINKTSSEQQIKEQSRLVSADGTLFFMQKYAIIPPNGSTSVAVEAAEPGTEGNIESGRLNLAALDSAAQSVVYAEVTSPLSGGSGESVKVIRDQDIAAAKDAAAQAARQKVEEEIRTQLTKGWNILEESWNSEEKDFQTSAKISDQQESIPYTASYNVRVMGYEDSVFQQKVQQALESRLDKDYMLFPGPISFTKSVESIDWDKQTANVTARVTHTTVPSFSVSTLRDKLAGRGEEEAENYLKGLKGVQAVHIKLWPFWVGTIPYIDSRIQLDLVPDKKP